jgi:hypothetical protein
VVESGIASWARLGIVGNRESPTCPKAATETPGSMGSLSTNAQHLILKGLSFGAALLSGVAVRRSIAILVS